MKCNKNSCPFSYEERAISRLHIDFLFYNIERTPDHLLMNIRDIESDQSERHKHYTDHDRIQHHDNPDI